ARGQEPEAVSSLRRRRGMSDLGKRGSAGTGLGAGTNYLPRLRLGESQLAGHLVNAARLGELGLTEAKLTVLLAQLIEHLLLALDAVAALNGVKVLQAIDHDEREEEGGGK